MIRIPNKSKGLTGVYRTQDPSDVDPNDILILSDNRLVYVDKNGDFIQVEGRYYDPWHKGYFAAAIIDSGDPVHVYSINIPSQSTQIVFNDPNSVYNYSAGASSTQAGYRLGGRGYNKTDTFSTIQKVEFSNDTTVSAIAGTLSNALFDHIGVNTSLCGYAASGEIYGYTPKTTVDRLDFSTDSVSKNITTTEFHKNGMAGVDNTLRGYALGGYDSVSGGSYNKYEGYLRIQFSEESFSAISASINWNENIAAYDALQSSLRAVSVGYDHAGTGRQDDILSFDFSTETETVLQDAALRPIGRTMAINATTYAYSIGGIDGSGLKLSTIDRFIFSSDTLQQEILALSDLFAPSYSFDSTGGFYKAFRC